MRRPDRALPDLALYVVLDPGLCAARGLVETALAALRGGAGVLQLRDKTGDRRARIAAARALRAAIAGAGARAALIVNDDAEACVAADADGLHVGQGDLPPARARALIGPDRLLGLSVETRAQAAAVDPALVDYAGAGPVFATPTKPGHAPPLGLDGLARLLAACPVPAVAIGGLGAAHAAACVRAGAAGLAVVSAVCAAPDPEAAARDIAAAVRAARAEVGQ